MPQAILIVDDDAELRQILLKALEALGPVSSAAGGREALLALKSLRPRLMLLDLAMPEMSGVDVLIAAREFDANLIVVMLTGESDLDVAKKTLELGARTYITKPFDMDVVFGEIKRLLVEPGPSPGAPGYRPWRVAT